MTDLPTRPFAAVLAEHRKGMTMLELSRVLAELSAAVLAHRKPGSVTLRLTLKPLGADGTVVLSDEILARVPTADRASSIFYADTSGNLTRSRPNQPELPGMSVIDGGMEAESA